MIVIAETAFNHEGDFDYLLRLIDAAADSGADMIKFQVLINADEFVSHGADSHGLITSWCFTLEQWQQALDRAESRGLRLFLMPLDTAAVALCERPSVEFVEIHSVSFNDQALIDAVQALPKTLAFGIGGRTLEEVEYLVATYGEDRLLLMHGFQAYPTDIEDVCFERINHLCQRFPGVRIGYADHSPPDSDESLEACLMAYARGLRIFEKHVTLEAERTDAQAGLLPQAMAHFVARMRRFHRLGNPDAASWQPMTDAELVYRQRQKQVVAAEAIEAGQAFTRNNLMLCMHTSAGSHTRISDLLGQSATSSYRSGEVIDEPAAD
ncbi:N-acetylneuraminate synthase family protein [Ferrimonas kyonanensis]|uniref:N-acetylneuraminate synthase family protein n=1 Tax=Ferrimonas kyonanensis TaxID=364763 RepID=UPI0003FFA1B9|nr:N-acetylneuraminate synthase family protein [Ferrimonas kyonanensis]